MSLDDGTDDGLCELRLDQSHLRCHVLIELYLLSQLLLQIPDPLLKHALLLYQLLFPLKHPQLLLSQELHDPAVGVPRQLRYDRALGRDQTRLHRSGHDVDRGLRILAANAALSVH